MKKRFMSTVAIGIATVVALTACSSGGADGSGSDPGNGDRQDLTIGVFSGWAEGIATSYLWKQVLDDKGYDVTLSSATAGPVFAGLSQGDFGVAFDVSLPYVHREYWKKYGDNLVDLGTWYDSVPLAIAVNKDAPIDSLTELAENADKFDNTIVGIEPGAGETGVVKDSVIPAYGLEDMDFTTSSTPAMLAELKKAIKQGHNVAVTLWHPHWAYSAFPIKDLKDPKGAFGEPDHLDVVGRPGFKADFPTLSKWLSDFSFPEDLLGDLENKLFNSGADESDYPDIVAKWAADHQDFVDGLTK